MSIIIDTKGLACPEPVIMTKKALEANDTITVIVDNKTAQENVCRFAKSQGCDIHEQEKDDGIYIYITKNTTAEINNDINKKESVPTVIVIPQNIMGRGNDELGSILIRGFIHTLTETSQLPDTMIFFNSGVKLTIKGSDVIEDLKNLEKNGVKILACGTCLNFFNIRNDLEVGTVSNMYDISETMISAQRLITL